MDDHRKHRFGLLHKGFRLPGIPHRSGANDLGAGEELVLSGVLHACRKVNVHGSDLGNSPVPDDRASERRKLYY